MIHFQGTHDKMIGSSIPQNSDLVKVKCVDAQGTCKIVLKVDQVTNTSITGYVEKMKESPSGIKNSMFHISEEIDPNTGIVREKVTFNYKL